MLDIISMHTCTASGRKWHARTIALRSASLRCIMRYHHSATEYIRLRCESSLYNPLKPRSHTEQQASLTIHHWTSGVCGPLADVTTVQPSRYTVFIYGERSVTERSRYVCEHGVRSPVRSPSDAAFAHRTLPFGFRMRHWARSPNKASFAALKPCSQ